MQQQPRFTVGAVQMTSGLDVKANLEVAAQLIGEAVSQGADLVALPEFFARIGRQRNDAFEIREHPGDGPIQRFLSEQARAHRVWILGGSMPIAGEDPQRVRAASLLFDADGQPVARYDKIHLFDVLVEGDSKRVYRESDGVEPGTEPVVAATPFATLGLSICYDLRFPELFRALSARGMDVLMVPSAFTAVTGDAHWEVLLRARAVENLCYVVAPAQVGLHEGGRETYGHTMVVDPWGTVMAHLSAGSGVVVQEIDLQALGELRRGFPALEHRKL